MDGSHIQRADNTATAFVQDMGVHHRGIDVLVPQELLHGTNIVARLE